MKVQDNLHLKIQFDISCTQRFRRNDQVITEDICCAHSNVNKVLQWQAGDVKSEEKHYDAAES